MLEGCALIRTASIRPVVPGGGESGAPHRQIPYGKLANVDYTLEGVEYSKHMTSDGEMFPWKFCCERQSERQTGRWVVINSNFPKGCAVSAAGEDLLREELLILGHRAPTERQPLRHLGKARADHAHLPFC